MFSRDEEIISDARANDDMVGLKELTTIPHIQEDENEKGDEVGTERDDMEKLAVVKPAETPVWLGDSSDKDDNDNDDIDYEESSNEGSDSEGSGDERSDNEGNDE
ncbi:hypothetical protein YC2023_117128 [Brassica napus]